MEINKVICDSFVDGYNRGKEDMLVNACEWLENFLEKTIQKPSINDGLTSDTIICADYRRRRLIRDVLCDFKKAMEL